MKINNNNFEHLEANIFLIKNFLSSFECDGLVKFAESSDKWNTKEEELGVDLDLKIEDKNYVKNLQDRISNLFFHQYHIEGANAIHRRQPGDFMELHSDSKGKNFPVIWGMTMYLNDFKHGEICYPSIDLEYKPNKGDLVIHATTTEKYLHKTKPSSDLRYSITVFARIPYL
jgi:hypothetical protein